MAESSIGQAGTIGPAEGRFIPSPALRRWLLVGVWALFAQFCLSTASIVWELSNEEKVEGLTASDVVNLAAALPQIFVLLGITSLARELCSTALWRSSIGFVGTAWIVQLLVVANPDDVGKLSVLVGVAAALGALFLLVIIVQKPSWCRPDSTAGDGDRAAEHVGESRRAPDGASVPSGVDSESEDRPLGDADDSDEGRASEDGEPRDAAPALPPQVLSEATGAAKPRLSSAGQGCLKIVAFVFAVAFLKVIVRKSGLSFETAIPICILVGICWMVFFGVWLGISKIRLRCRIGRVAAISGGADIVGSVLVIGVLAYGAWLFVDAALNGRGDSAESVLAGTTVPFAIADAYDLLLIVLTAALFISVRGRTANEGAEASASRW